MDDDGLERLLRRQDGVVSRRQLTELGARPHELARLVRRRRLVRVLPGVYVDHTGPLAWSQRAWAGVLALWPAALDRESALVLPSRDGPRQVQLVVDHSRRVQTPPGYQVRRTRRLADRVRWNASPPRLLIEAAAIEVAAGGSDLDAVELVAALCRDRRTTPSRLRAELVGRRAHPRRAWVLAVLEDVESGACSVLERGYLDRVERPHGLPQAVRQVAARDADGRSMFRDVEHAPYGLVVELDVRMFHDNPRQRARDLQRDLEAALSGRQTVRLAWTQVFDTACRTASTVGQLLTLRGWRGGVRPCGPACAARRTA